MFRMPNGATLSQEEPDLDNRLGYSFFYSESSPNNEEIPIHLRIPGFVLISKYIRIIEHTDITEVTVLWICKIHSVGV